MKKITYLFFGLLLTINLNCQNQTQMKHKYTNHLINETSPYLLQHAHNPVDWYPWGKEALDKARRENKPLIISIGYSSCHWCHVMEHESFENEEIARIMNENFVCIKVDREEHPDIDRLYMNAVEMISGHGGWPLNCFALPDGTPFYGGTYFRPNQWKSVLEQIARKWQQNPQELILAAEHLKAGLVQRDLVSTPAQSQKIFLSKIMQAVEAWKKSFDPVYGGNKTNIKFPMPATLQFLLDYYFFTQDTGAFNHVDNTLRHMAWGGIYDHVGGGFARYSTDRKWLVPHFEKMLYDNAQLIQLYSNAFKLTHDDLYKKVTQQTIDFLMRQMYDTDGYFYSALDADSQGEEGKYYVWTYDELQKSLPEYMHILKEVYDIRPSGNWEGKIIFYQKRPIQEAANRLGMSTQQLEDKLEQVREELLSIRAQRVPPSLDDKSITSWNAMMISGLVTAYQALGNGQYLQTAQKVERHIEQHMLDQDMTLWRIYKDGHRKIPGYMDDYAFFIKALIDLFETTGNGHYLQLAQQITLYTMQHFWDHDSQMFFYTSDMVPTHIKRDKEVTDNVIPSSNAVMAQNLFLLSQIGDYPEWDTIARQMTANIADYLYEYLSYFAMWGQLALKQLYPFYELVITGPGAREKARQFLKFYRPDVVLAFTDQQSNLKIFKDRFKPGETLFFVCQGNTCKIPTDDMNVALKLLDKK